MRRRSTNKRTYTKRAVKVLLVIGVINAEIPYVLSAFDKTPIETLGIAWITEVVAVILGYMCKSFFETRQEKKQALEDRKAELQEYTLFNGLKEDTDERDNI
jgi:hypothetical protein